VQVCLAQLPERFKRVLQSTRYLARSYLISREVIGLAKDWDSYCRIVEKKYKIVYDFGLSREKIDIRSLTGDEVLALYIQQDGRCGICCKVIYFPVPEMNPWGKSEYIRDENGLDAKVVIDHNHDRNITRGLLCNRCNGFIPEDTYIGLSLRYLMETEDATTILNLFEFLRTDGPTVYSRQEAEIVRHAKYDAEERIENFLNDKTGNRSMRRARAKIAKSQKRKREMIKQMRAI
jgi:hypothetical protein